MADQRSRRILHVMPSLNCGGIENSIVRAAEIMAPQGYDFDFLVENSGKQDLTERAETAGGRVHPIGRFQSVAFPLRLYRFLRQSGPYDAIHSHTYMFSGLIVFIAYLAGVNIRICHIHSDRRNAKRSVFNFLYSLCLQWLIVRFSSEIVAVSGGALDALLGRAARAKVKSHIRPMGIDMRPFIADFDYEALRSELGLMPDRKYLVQLGRFSHEKNHRFTLDLYKALAESNDKLDLLLIGEGPLLEAFKKEVTELGLGARVIFTGNRQDVPFILRSLPDHSCGLMPSLYEGFGLAAAEMQLAALYTVVSDNLPETVDIGAGLLSRLSLDISAPWRAQIEHVVSGGTPVDGVAFDIKKCDLSIGNYCKFAASLYSR